MTLLPLFDPDIDGRRKLYRCYEEMEARYHLRHDPSLGRQFNFSDNSQAPVQGWYMFKEGFSAQLVGLFLNEFRVPRAGGRVVDPFSGSGTTVLEAQTRGYEALGVEVNPFFVQVASTKLGWHLVDPDRIAPLIDAILDSPLRDSGQEGWPELTSFRRLYPEEVLAELLRLRELVGCLATGPEKSFLLLGLSSILELTSRAYKTGKGLKFRKREGIATREEVRGRARLKWQRMADEVRQLQHQRPDRAASVVRGDARFLPIRDGWADLVLYSPPYANTFDYNEVYKLEMWFLEHVTSYEQWKRVKQASLRSHVSLRVATQSQGDGLVEQALACLGNPAHGEEHMLRAYFADMTAALREQKRITRDGGHIVIIVGNSSYQCVPIATDLLLAHIAESLGLRVKEVREGRRLNTSSQQMARYRDNDWDGLKFVRESAVILER